jgi:uncharacterized protein (DUF2141 family)
MKNLTLMMAAVAICWTSANAADKKAKETHDLTVNVTEAPGKEDIVIALFTDKKGFPEDMTKAAYTATVTAKNPSHIFEKIPAGKYVVVVFQDKDGDGKLTRGDFGPPKEPIGMSNHPKIAPPKNMPDFDKAKVDVTKATSVDVNLITLGK